MWKSQANCKQFKQLTFENQQNPSISALSEAVLFLQKLLNYFTSIIRIFPLESSFSQQQFSWNMKSSFLHWCPSTRAMPTLPQSGGSATQTGEHTSQQPVRECLASKLNLVAAPDAGAFLFSSRKEAFTHLWTWYLANCKGMYSSTSQVAICTAATSECKYRCLPQMTKVNDFLHFWRDLKQKY